MRNEGFVDIDFRGSQSHNSIRIAIALSNTRIIGTFKPRLANLNNNWQTLSELI
jgi:hypothetical protein